jgi:hypothetical protein
MTLDVIANGTQLPHPMAFRTVAGLFAATDVQYFTLTNFVVFHLGVLGRGSNIPYIIIVY